MTNQTEISSLLAELSTDVKWIKEFVKEFPEECNKRYAKKYVEKLQWLAIGGLVTVIIQNINKAMAFFN